ncbi:aspartyl-tRNA(Asn)/glutamyl-tRNA(Gln) amidotransferase subunit A [Phyllobacterium myrsinacearum]|uniref:Aspartyl-tRNA(Asn)/glutamyl-tRNA(Gln) amidotransferase subunit A n=1 Tax=Phyllobacterium myrsinacearum TaxID=28101 RepID=A0A839EEI5_9HYPH|nr:aspartyl-tRNA(Asn)/glutamyl-tRNA(Gln) amidotransferase subunit A [Phyllobacterium myrsinacearum]
MSRSTGSARDKLEQSLAAIAARDGPVFVKLYADTACKEADASDQRAQDGNLLGPLDGKIVSIKDLFDVTGEPTLAGSVVRSSAPAAVKDAVIVERLRNAGAVVIGKTLMTEFAFTAVGLNPHYSIAGNAVDPGRVAGGSSTGAGVSVADGTSEISIGSDTGGSIRIPAALNGVVGFKPTAKRVPLQGAFPLSPSLDSIGPLARSVADCAIADAVMAGERMAFAEPVSLTGIRIAMPRGSVLDAMEPAIAAAFETSLRLCEKAGAVLVDFMLDDLIHEMAEATSIGSIAGIEGSRVHAGWLNDTGLDVDPRVQRPLLRRLGVSEAAYIDLIQQRQALVHKMDQRMTAFDLLALPTSPITAPPIASVVNDDEFYKRTEGLLLRNPQIANQFDLTAISLPMPDLALPGGLMLFARHGADRQLLSMTLSVERLLT